MWHRVPMRDCVPEFGELPKKNGARFPVSFELSGKLKPKKITD
jgi:hypothetical protein